MIIVILLRQWNVYLRNCTKAYTAYVLFHLYFCEMIETRFGTIAGYATTPHTIIIIIIMFMTKYAVTILSRNSRYSFTFLTVSTYTRALAILCAPQNETIRHLVGIIIQNSELWKRDKHGGVILLPIIIIVLQPTQRRTEMRRGAVCLLRHYLPNEFIRQWNIIVSNSGNTHVSHLLDLVWCKGRGRSTAILIFYFLSKPTIIFF